MTPAKTTPQTKTTSLDDRVGYHLVRTAMRVRRRYLDDLGVCGLLPNHHAILAVLNEDGPTYQKQLAERTTVDAGDLVAYLDALENKKYVTRTRDPQDRRRQMVTVTRGGRLKLAEADQCLSATEQTLFGHLGDAERKQLVETMRAIYLRTSRPTTDL